MESMRRGMIAFLCVVAFMFGVVALAEHGAMRLLSGAVCVMALYFLAEVVLDPTK